MILLYAVLNTILNRFPRGTYSWGPWVAAAILAALILAITANPYAAGAFFAGYAAGESFGWGKWLSMIPKWDDKSFTQADYLQSPAYKRDDGHNNGVHFLANRLASEAKDFRKYGRYALMLRGALWAVCIFVPMVAVGAVSVLALPLAVAAYATFPYCYHFTFKRFGQDKYWPNGEILYGAVQGLTMAAALSLSGF